MRSFFRQIDASSLAVFRIMFGSLILFESVNYGVFLCLDCMYRNTSLLFKYHHFEWAVLPPGIGLELIFLVMGVAALCVILGYRYRLAMLVCTLCFTYHFLLDQALYLNHFYLVILFCILMIFVPANCMLSLDARRNSAIASPSVPSWSRILLLIQLEIVLLYAGFVKLNLDWLNLEPMRMWMNRLSHDAAPFFQWVTQDWGIALASYGVILLHLVGAPLLLWKRTRLIVFCLYGVFHIINSLVFNIGIFPWMTLAATLLFFDPDWPRQFLKAVQSRGSLLKFQKFARSSFQSTSSTPSVSLASAGIVLAIALWSAVQIGVPLRHFTAEGNVAWNEDGHRFSWRMKLRSKSGNAMFVALREDGQRWEVNPTDYLNRKQAAKMVCIPDLIWQFAQFLEQEFNDSGTLDVRVYADAMCSLNSRERAALINRLVDLTSIPRSEPVVNWTYPLSKALPDPLF